MVYQIVIDGVNVVTDGGHHHAVVPAWLELVEAEASVLHQNTATVAIEGLQLMVSYLYKHYITGSSPDVSGISKFSIDCLVIQLTLKES